ncbi:MAG: hypothetical protein M3R49_00665 [Chloroflexota bacterium]|nr:hypothetical protein [Chloroflexota bacterium]
MLRLRSVLPVVSLLVAACGNTPATTPGSMALSDPPGEASTLTPAPGGTGRPENSPRTLALPPGLAAFPVPPEARAMPLPGGSLLVARWAVEPGSGAYRFFRDALPAAGYSITWLGPGDSVAILRFEDRTGGAWQIDIHGDLESAVLDLGPEHP